MYLRIKNDVRYFQINRDLRDKKDLLLNFERDNLNKKEVVYQVYDNNYRIGKFGVL